MFCENCGKSLIRGFNFCIECGTPVPPENVEPEQTAAEEQSQGMPEIQPTSNDGGTLVFCTNCGMRMQSSTAYCEKCGQQLQNSSAASDPYSNLPKNGEVPLWNTERVDYGYETMSDGEIEQINNFMNGGGVENAADYGDYTEIGSGDTFANAIGGADGSSMTDIGDSAAEIDALTAQFANMVQPSGSEMPAIGAQETKIQDEVIKVENFAMDNSYVDDAYVDQGALPVIEGASMEEPEPEDPNAFVMTSEAIEDITPAYEPAEEIAEEPVSEEKNDNAPIFAAAAGIAAEALSEAYEAVEEAAPVYEEPVAETPIYEEPVVETPVYEEPVAETPVYEEPVAEVPVYEEAVTEVPAYEDVPAYEEAAEDTTPAEEPFAIPLYGADGDTSSYFQQTEPEYSSDIPLFGAPEEEAPVYTEPETPAYEEPSVIPAYDEPAADIPTYGETPAESNDTAAVAAAAFTGAAIANGLAAEESAPVTDYSIPAETDHNSTYDTYNSSADTSAASFAAAAAVTAAEDPEPAVDLGKLVYCRNCGQDMYEKETVCKNCGAPKRPEYQPPRTRQGKTKEPFKLFGVFSIPSLIVIAVVIVALVALLVPSLKKNDIVDDTSSKPSTSTTSGISGNEQLNAGNTSDDEDDSSVTTEPEQTTAATTTATTTAPIESTPTDAESEEPAETTKPALSGSVSTPASSATTPMTTPSAATTPATTPLTTTTPKPAATTTHQQTGGAYTPSATITAQNKERDKMIAAYELMAEEIGKVDLLARTTSYAIMFDSRDADTAGKSFYSRDVAAAMLKNIKSGKSSVAAAVASAKPSTAELNSAYNALRSLEDKYNAYLDYVVNATKFSSYESKCDSYMSSFTSYASSSFILSVMNTSAQSSTDKAEYYASVVSEAVAAAENAAAAYSTLRTKVTTALTESNFSNQFLSVMNENISTYLKAAKYTQAVSSYCDILSSAPSSYSAAYSGIKTARDNLNSLADLFALAQYDNTLANFKSSANSYIGSASAGAAMAKNSL